MLCINLERVLYINLGKKAGGQPEKPEKTGTEEKGIEASQAGPSQPKQQPLQPLQQQKKLHQEPEAPPQLGAVGGSDAGSSRQKKKKQMQQVQQQQLPPPPPLQQPAKSPSGDAGARGFGRGQTQPDRGQAGMVMRTFFISSSLSSFCRYKKFCRHEIYHCHYTISGNCCMNVSYGICQEQVSSFCFSVLHLLCEY
jgi:hypothetical protein